MRKKELKIVISFHTTAEAIAMEAECQKDEIPGRLIPVPRQISAGCGLAWSMPVAWEGQREDSLGGIGQWMEEKKLRWDNLGVYEI
ncbi:DUF3343 domain-containing protein [Lacrimispora sp.]|uniref:DUF3343 domain-containing protein n=1 Tax=Lacrimispora sp. TaxID=2719234 RepID=UPI003460E5E3